MTTRRRRVHLSTYTQDGLFLNKDWAIGIILGMGCTSMVVIRATTFVSLPLHDTTICIKGPFNLYLDGGIGYNYAKANGGEGSSGFEVGIRPGACVDLTEGFAYVCGWALWGIETISLAERSQVCPTMASAFTCPEELMVGLEDEF